MEKAQALVRFIIALIILGGIITGLVWVNSGDKKSFVERPDDKEQCVGGPSAVEHDTLTMWGHTSDYPVKGEMVTFEGYIALPNLTYTNGKTNLVNLRRDSTSRSAYVTMIIPEGDCENTMEPLPSSYDYSDLVIRDNTGIKIGHGDKVRVTGKVTDNVSLYRFFVKRVDKIQADDSASAQESHDAVK